MKDTFRDKRGFAWLQTLVQDVSHGARLLRRRPGFTLAAGLSLGLGIGATTAIFSVLNAVALRPLPYPDSDRLVWMTQVLKKNSTDELTMTPHFLEWRRQNQSFTDLAGYNPQIFSLSGVDQAVELDSAKVSASLLPILGIQPVLGRNFLKSEDYKGYDQVALISHSLWQKHFGGRRDIVGKSITLGGAPFLVVGVLPAGFVFPGLRQPQVLTPLGKDEAAELQYNTVSIVRNVIGRLKPGVSLQQAIAELTVLQARLPLPAFRPVISLKIMPLRTSLFGDVTTAGYVLLAAAGFLLLIASANVSNLLLARWMQRDREFAIRCALGGSGARLICQLLTESGVLGAVACAAGIALAFGLRRPLLALSSYRGAALPELPFDGRVLGFAIAIGMLTTLLFGLLPAFRMARPRIAEAIKVGEAAVVGGRGSLRVLSALAAAEIATTLALSAGAGLMLQSFWKMRYANLGFHPDHLVAASMNLFGRSYQDPQRRSAFVQDLLTRAANLPGVELAAVTRSGELPPGVFHATNTFAIEGRNQPVGGSRPIARYPTVSPGYFAIMGIPLREGRLLQESDQMDAPHVVVVNEALVRRYFDSHSPVGHRVRIGPDTEPWSTIAGVVGDVKTSGLTTAPEPSVYLPYRQTEPISDVGLVLRSPLSAGVIAGEVRKMVAALDSNQPVAVVESMDDRLNASVSAPRFTTILLFAFAGIAVALGWIGVYGVMGCRVRWQLRELAVRQALGAGRGDIVRHVFREGIAIIVPGLVLGLVAAAALTRLLAGMLYQMPARDPLTLGVVGAGLAVVALLACCIPAMQAAAADPLDLLRQE